LHQVVQCRDDYHGFPNWKTGTVVCLSPLKIHPYEWKAGFEWTSVRRLVTETFAVNDYIEVAHCLDLDTQPVVRLEKGRLGIVKLIDVNNDMMVKFDGIDVWQRILFEHIHRLKKIEKNPHHIRNLVPMRVGNPSSGSSSGSSRQNVVHDYENQRGMPVVLVDSCRLSPVDSCRLSPVPPATASPQQFFETISWRARHSRRCDGQGNLLHRRTPRQ